MVGSCPELWAFFGSWGTPHVHVVRVGTGGTERLCSWVLGSLSYSDKPDYVVNTNMKTFLFIPLRPLIWLIFLKLENCLLVCFERCKNHTKLERNWEKKQDKMPCNWKVLSNSTDCCPAIVSLCFLFQWSTPLIERAPLPGVQADFIACWLCGNFLKSRNSIYGSLTRAISTLEYVTV